MPSAIAADKKGSLVVRGAQEFHDYLADVDKALRKTIMTEVIREGAKPIREAVKANALEIADTGALAKSIIYTVRTNKRTGKTTARIGPDNRFSIEVDDVNPITGKTYKRRMVPYKYMHLVELGTKPHSLGKGQSSREMFMSSIKALVFGRGAYHRGSEPKGILRRAMDETESQSIANMKRRFIKLVNENFGTDLKDFPIG